MKKTIKDSTLFSAAFSSETYKDFFQFLERKNPMDYDKIMDKAYAESHIGGGGHRSFDGSHTLGESWEKIQEATGDVELAKFAKAHFNELVTPEGIPLFNLDHGAYNSLSEEISDVLGGSISGGQIRDYFRDINSINLGEVGVAGLGVLFMGAAIKNGDSRAISRVAASNLCLGLYSGNPAQLLVGLTGLAYGIYKGKIKAYDLLRGAIPTVAGIAGYQAGKLLELGSGGTLILSLASGIAVEAVLNKLEQSKLEEVKEELGDNPKYISTYTPAVLAEEFKILCRASGIIKPVI